jgi:hypothetical protein
MGKTRGPQMRHPTTQPAKKPAGPKKPHIPAFVPPKFFDLPDKDKRYRNEKKPTTRLFYFTKSQLAQYTHIQIGYGVYMSVVHGKVEKGAFVAHYNSSGRIDRLDRAPDYMQGTPRLNTEKAMARHALYLWRHDRVQYAAFKKGVLASRAQTLNRARKAYDDWVADTKNKYAKDKYEFEQSWREYEAKAPPRW